MKKTLLAFLVMLVSPSYASTTLFSNSTTGNVGIGTSSPVGILDVEGGTAAASTNGSPIDLVAQSAGTGNQSGGNIVLMPGVATGTGTPGYVGVGTTNPKQELVINGNVDAMGSSNGYLTEIANDTTTGTTQFGLAKLTTLGSAIISATTDTDGIVGVTVSPTATSGNAQIAINGQSTCKFENATTKGDFVTIGSSTAGDCHDAGSSRSSTAQMIGRVLTSGAANTNQTIDLQLNGASSASGVTGSGTTNYVTKWTGATTVGTSALYDNGTEVGIGTNSPANALDISSGQGIHLASGTPTSTANALYAIGTSLQWNGAAIGSGGSSSPYDVYADPNTQMLLHMENNTNDSSIFGYTMTNSGVTFSNSIYKLGSYSAFFNGTSSSGDYMYSTANLQPTSNMTVDFFVYFTGNIPYKATTGLYIENLFNLGGVGSSTGQIGVNSGTSSGVPSAISVEWGTNTNAISVSYSFSLNTWYHIAFEAIGSNCYLWINGTPVSTSTTNVATPGVAPLYIGYIPSSGYYDYLLGYEDEFRISTAVRYQPGVSFTPPTAPYNPGPIQ